MADSRNEDIVTTYAFSSRYHSPELYNLNDGEIITIPQNFTIFQHYVEQIKSEGRFSVSDKKAHAIEYINVLTNTGHIVEFHPLILLSSFAFEVDEYGRNIRENGHMVKSKIESEVTRFVSGFRNLTEAIRAMEGCQIKYNFYKRIRVRDFGVEECLATIRDVTSKDIIKWTFVGVKRPVGYL